MATAGFVCRILTRPNRATVLFSVDGLVQRRARNRQPRLRLEQAEDCGVRSPDDLNRRRHRTCRSTASAGVLQVVVTAPVETAMFASVTPMLRLPERRRVLRVDERIVVVAGRLRRGDASPGPCGAPRCIRCAVSTTKITFGVAVFRNSSGSTCAERARLPPPREWRPSGSAGGNPTGDHYDTPPVPDSVCMSSSCRASARPPCARGGSARPARADRCSRARARSCRCGRPSSR